MKIERRDKKANVKKGDCLHGDRIKSECKVFSKRFFSLTLTGILFFAIAIASATAATNVTDPIAKITSNGIGWILGLIALVAFALIAPVIIIIGLSRNDLKTEYALGLPKHSVRALLAFSLIVLIAIMLILFGSGNEITTALLAILASTVAFYFGQRGTEPEAKPEKEEPKK